MKKIIWFIQFKIYFLAPLLFGETDLLAPFLGFGDPALLAPFLGFGDWERALLPLLEPPSVGVDVDVGGAIPDDADDDGGDDADVGGGDDADVGGGDDADVGGGGDDGPSGGSPPLRFL